MKIVCPKNDKHGRFTVTAHVAQLWLVDKGGHFHSVGADCIEVTHEPDGDDRFVCWECGAEARVEQ